MEPYTPGERRHGAIKLSSNENPRGCSPLAAHALRSAIDEAHIYPDGAARALKTAIADHIGTRPDQIILGNGSDEVLTFIAGTYLNPGDHVLIGEHTFSQYAFATRLFDGVVRTVPMLELRFEAEPFLDRIDASVRIVFLCSPNNPTGLSITRDTLKRFLERIPGEVLIVVDHAYIDYQDDESACDALWEIAAHKNLIILRTFSKLHGLAALRVGYGVSVPERIAELERVRSPFNVNTFAQFAATASLEDSAFLEETCTINRQGKARMGALLSDLGIEYLPSQANFITMRVPAMTEIERPNNGSSGGNAREFARRLVEEGITVRPLNSFGLPDYVRITIGTPEQISLLETALRRIVETGRDG